MKMKKEHYNHIEKQIKEALKNAGYNIKDGIKECRKKGYSDKAIRWYFLNGAKLTPFVCGTLYKYLNDDNIDTALRKITNTK